MKNRIRIEKKRLRVSRLSRTIALSLALPAAGLSQSALADCEELDGLLVTSGDALLAVFSDAEDIARAGDATVCADYVTRARAQGIRATTGTDGATSTEGATTETVQVEEEATIEGDVSVRLPDPEVTVEQDPANVSVTTPPVDVNVTQVQPTIEIRQAQPIVRVQLPQPTITVEQPAPEITITMPDPDVAVASAQPQIDIVVPEPRVTVRQGEPSLSVDLQTSVGGDDGAAPARSSLQRNDEEGLMTVQVEGLSSEPAAAEVQFLDSEQQANVTFEKQEPNVTYLAAEPEIIVEASEEPAIVEVVESGEPKIMVLSEAREEGANAQSLTGDAGQRDPKEAMAASDAPAGEELTETISVGDLNGMQVVNGRDEELGEVERVVKNGTDTFVIVEHGGWFLGLSGKEFALPIDDTFVNQERVVLRGLTEEQVDKLPDYEYANELTLEDSEMLEIRKIN